MRTLYLDCETNGLPVGGRPSFTDTRAWPYAVSVSWQLREDGAAVVEDFDAIVKPRQGMNWDRGAQQFHGISKERAEQQGRDITEILFALRSAIASADLLVAHNMEFDKNVLLAEAVRVHGANAAEAWLWPRGKSETCTMKSTVDLVRAPPFKNNRYKFPRQEELHHFLFGCNFDMPLHNSKNDVACLVKCHEELLRRGVGA